eukprot:10984443-Lingulodinium_polyedra.AAC.1
MCSHEYGRGPGSNKTAPPRPPWPSAASALNLGAQNGTSPSTSQGPPGPLPAPGSITPARKPPWPPRGRQSR